jgi:hypothetical protein
MTKLAAAQKESAYGLRVSMGTLNALEARGLVRSVRGVGSIAFPHTSIMWRLTDAGRAALAPTP